MAHQAVGTTSGLNSREIVLYGGSMSRATPRLGPETQYPTIETPAIMPK